MTKDDKKIRELQNKIRWEQERIWQAKKYTPRTTCVLKLANGIEFHLKEMSVNELNQALIIVQSLICTAIPMGIADTLFGGFTLEEWKEDINGIKEQNFVMERKAAITQYANELKEILPEEEKNKLDIKTIVNAFDNI